MRLGPLLLPTYSLGGQILRRRSVWRDAQAKDRDLASRCSLCSAGQAPSGLASRTTPVGASEEVGDMSIRALAT